MSNQNQSGSLAKTVISDDGVQRAAAGLAISVVVAVAKNMLFPST